MFDVDGLLLANIQWQYFFGSTPLEVVATLCAVAGVLLIARQKILGWPLGICWAAISAYLAFTSWSLISDGILYLAYIPIQGYCWSVWIRRGNGCDDDDPSFLPTWLSTRTQLVLFVAAGLSILAWAVCISTLAQNISWIPQPALLWRDSTTTVLNFYAQFLQARKRMENWVVWLVVNVLGIHIYWVKGAPIYAAQYGFFLLLGLYGWWQWRRDMQRQQS